MTLADVIRLMRRHGADRLLAKPLAENDNSKNQIYLGPDLSALQLFPSGVVQPDSTRPQILKATVDFSWIVSDDEAARAPHAQLILYPQYPEIRLSALLLGARGAPSDIVASRSPGRVLFLGISRAGTILGLIARPHSTAAREFRGRRDALQRVGVFFELPVGAQDSRTQLLRQLARIHHAGWITAKRLDASNNTLPCDAPNCGGYTLEAELGVRPNGYSEPDFHGWEIKQHSVSSVASSIGSARITLMTPEPTGGFYRDAGAQAFIRRYGYRVDADRLNFGGIHVAGRRCEASGLTLVLHGWDRIRERLEASGSISLMDDRNRVAAEWSFVSVMAHWKRKHAQAAYVPSMTRQASGTRQYRYSNHVRLGEGTDFVRLLKAIDAGSVYYDPGLKLEQASSPRPRMKRRSQFRIASQRISALYDRLEQVDVLQP